MIYLAIYLVCLTLFGAAILRHMSRRQRRVMRLHHYYSTDASRSRAHAEPRFKRREAVVPNHLETATRIRDVGARRPGLLRLEHPLPAANGLRRSA